jgi:serine phosphatase RsbU (regulator of sigma subunit)
MERDAAIALVRELLSAARRDDSARLSELYAEDAVAVSPLFGEVRGNRAIAQLWHQMAVGFPDFSAEISHVLVDGDRVAVLSSVAATDHLSWPGRRASGGSLSYKLVMLFTIADNRFVRDERIYDSANLIQRIEKERLEKELRTAADVQRALLWQTHHRAPWSETVGDSIPCRAIGGDFFAFLDLPSGEVGIMLGDVAGKGPAAALLAALVQGMFDIEAPAGGGPAATLARINRRLAARDLAAKYATMTYGVLEAGGGFVYANAGHLPPALVTADGISWLTAGGPAVGMFADARFDEERLSLNGGETLVLFSDGVPDARNRADEEFGQDRLVDSLLAGVGDGPRGVLDRVLASVREFCGGADPMDDITVAVTRFTGRTA